MDSHQLETMSFDCPYQASRSLKLLYTSASNPTLSTELDVTILHVFTPFTLSQVIVVQVPQPNIFGLPQQVVLKIYDRRFITGHRRDGDEPWSPLTEIAAAERWRAIDSGMMEDDYEETDSDYYNEGQLEESYLLRTERWFKRERDIYARLVDLQGSRIPAFYGEARVLHQRRSSVDPRYSPAAIALEYIPAPTLAEIDMSILAQHPPLMRSLIATAQELSCRGVVHGDIRLRNILVALPPKHSPRIVLFDFAWGALRTPDVTDEQWSVELQMTDDIGAVKHMLHFAGVRSSSPTLPQPEQPSHPGWPNVRKEDWVRRWYDRISDGSTGGAPKLDVDGEAILWKMKPEVTAWLERRDPESIAEIYRPRPGSPDYAWNTRPVQLSQ